MKTGMSGRIAKRAAAPAVIACMLSVTGAGAAQAAQAGDVRKQGWDAMSEDRKEAFRTGIAQIPDDLINLHRIEGGVCGLLIGY